MKVAVKLVIAFAVIGALIAGCKQAAGERCQVTADCEDGLECNQATMVCQGSGGDMIDAVVPVLIDAPLDAPFTLIDAPLDAPPDAP